MGIPHLWERNTYNTLTSCDPYHNGRLRFPLVTVDQLPPIHMNIRRIYRKPRGVQDVPIWIFLRVWAAACKCVGFDNEDFLLMLIHAQNSVDIWRSARFVFNFSIPLEVHVDDNIYLLVSDKHYCHLGVHWNKEWNDVELIIRRETVQVHYVIFLYICSNL